MIRLMARENDYHEALLKENARIKAVPVDLTGYILEVTEIMRKMRNNSAES